MFKIYTDDLLMYDDESHLESLKVVSPKLTLSQSSAGTFTMTVPPTNVGYDHLERLTSWIRIFKNTSEDPYWEGRIISETTDFWNCKKITCEGILGVLNDTIQPPYHYQDQTARSFLSALLDIHNEKVDAWKKIYVGNTDSQLTYDHRYTNYESTLECITDKLVEREGGYIQIRYDDGKRYLDYLTTYDSENSQKIEFGKNLFDFSKSFSSEDYCTVLVPRGMQLGEGPYEALIPYVDVKTVNNGSIYVTLTDDDFDTPPDVLPVEEFVWIEAVHDWEDVSLPSNLLKKAKDFLKSVQFDNMKLEVSALDMRYAGAQYEEINLNDTVRVKSTPHGLDRLFPVTKLDIPLDAPENTTFTLGTDVKVSLTHREKNIQSVIKNEIASIPSETHLTEKIRADAASEIDNALTGYINVIRNPVTGAEEFIVSTLPNYLDPQAQLWRWTANGLAYYPNGYAHPENAAIAITDQGTISADLISAGTLIADIIKAGILKDQDTNGNRFYFNVKTGELRIKSVSDLQDQVDNIKIGSRNYLWAVDGAIHEGVKAQDCSYEYYPENNGEYKITCTSTSHFAQIYYSIDGMRGYPIPDEIKGETLLLHAESISATGTDPTPRFYVSFLDFNNEEISAPFIDSSTLSKTITVPSNAVRMDILIRVRQSGTREVGEVATFRGVKLEKGTLATDWTPAPEDSQSQFARMGDIGGRNILKNSATAKITLRAGASGTFTENIAVSEWACSDAMQVTGNIGSENVFAIFGDIYATTKASISGRSYTYSVYVKNVGNKELRFVANVGGYDRETVAPGECKRVVVHGVGNGSGYVQLNCGATVSEDPEIGSSFDFIYWHPKIEYGDVVTDWSPAPEDISKAISDGDSNTSNSVLETVSNQFEITNRKLDSTYETVELINGNDSTEGSFRQILKSSLEQTSEELEITMDRKLDYANGVSDKVEAHFNFSTNGLDISGTEGSDSGSKLHLASDEVSLMENGSKRLWLNSNGANVEALNADYYLKVGNADTGSFIWEAYSSGFRLRKG